MLVCGASNHVSVCGISCHLSVRGVSSHLSVCGVSSHLSVCGISSHLSVSGVSSHMYVCGISSHVSNIRIIVQQFNCEFLLPTITKITHNILSTVAGGKGREINMGEMTQNLQFSS